MSYYLLDNRNPNGQWFYTSRSRRLVGIVVHCTAGLEDLDGQPDHSAENTARYAATTARPVSWHSGSDTDSNLELLPPHYTAFQCRGYNSSTYGHELSKRNMVWEGMPAWWVTATLTRPAAHLRRVADDAGIPVRKISKSQLDAAIAAGDPSMGGFIGHRELDPTRRTDPGVDFPWERFLSLIRGDDQGGPQVFLPLRRSEADQRKSDVAAVASLLNAGYGTTIPTNGTWPSEMTAKLREVAADPNNLDGTMVTGQMYGDILVQVARVQGSSSGVVPRHEHTIKTLIVE